MCTTWGDSTSQALDWYKQGSHYTLGLIEFYKELEREMLTNPGSYGGGSHSRYEALARADSYNSSFQLATNRPFRIYRP
jgi:hypothetical protein